MNDKQSILRFAAKRGLFRPRDLPPTLKNASRALRELLDEGLIVRLARGLYARADYQPSSHQGITAACAIIPHGVVCLLSALDFHGFTVQQPYHHWIAVNHSGPVASHGLPLRIVRMTGSHFEMGIEKHYVDGNRVRVYCAAKTIADCFRYRNKIGIDVAIEALQEGWLLRRFTMDELDKYADACRVLNVMRPYREMMLA